MANSARRSSRAVNPAQLLSLFLAFVLVSTTGGLVAAGLVMPAVATIGATANATTQLFDELPTELGSEQVSQQSRIYSSGGTLIATFYAENRITVPLEEISEHMANAVVAIEDHRFYEHGGVDPEGLMRAAVVNLTGGGVVQGGSSLTQQYVKNVLIEAGRISGDTEAIEAARAQTLGRKLREAKLAIALERVRTKDEILEGYLNIAQFGPSQWGVEVAANYYFNKSAADLDIAEAALLAGITQSPARYDPEGNPVNAQNRRNTVLLTMRQQDFITEEEFRDALAIEVEDMLDITPTRRGCGAAGRSAYFCRYVTETILTDPAFGETRAERSQLLVRGGLEIHTTIDLNMQRTAHDTVMGTIPPDDPSGISTAISTVEPGTGYIKAMAQNTEYGNASNTNTRATEVNFNADQRYGGGLGFQTGSTFKIYVLAAWLQEGRNLMEEVDGAPGQEFARETWNFSCAPDVADDYPPRNIEGVGRGPMSVLDATRQSVNTAYVNMANQMDMCDVDELARATGLHVGSGVDERSGRPLRLSPSMVLGANEIAPLTMAASVATFASGGTYCRPIAILSINDTAGNELPVPQPECEEVLDAEVVRGLNWALQETVRGERGTGWRAALPGGRPVAGKTGTANDNSNAWFVGYVPQYATAVWVGHSEGIVPMQYVTVNGRFIEFVNGGNLPAPMWSEYMSQVVEGLPVETFPEPQERTIIGERVPVPNVVGWSMDGAQRYLEAQGFSVRVGDPVESWAARGNVGGTSPGPGSQVSPNATITLRPSDGPPPPEDEEDDDDNGGDDGDSGDTDASGRGDGRADRGSARTGWGQGGDSGSRWGSWWDEDDNRGGQGRGGRGGG